MIILATAGAIAIADAGTIETTTSTVALQGVGAGTIDTGAHHITTADDLNGVGRGSRRIVDRAQLHGGAIQEADDQMPTIIDPRNKTTC